MRKKTKNFNQSRICGKGVGLGLFSSDSLQSQLYYGVENDCRNFRSNRMDSFRKNQKKVEKWLFLAIFGLILARFLTSQQYEFNEIAHKGPYYSVE